MREGDGGDERAVGGGDEDDGADGHGAEDAATALVDEYEIDAETAAKDAAECLEDMVARQILVAE